MQDEHFSVLAMKNRLLFLIVFPAAARVAPLSPAAGAVVDFKE
jgi:hypothetical protein